MGRSRYPRKERTVNESSRPCCEWPGDHTQQTSPVVALNGQARDVGDDPVADHRHPQPPRVPQEERWARGEDQPVRQLGPPRLDGEALEVRTVPDAHTSLRESAPEQRAGFGESVLPPFDAQPPLVEAAAGLEA